MTGTVLVCDKHAHVLFDPGATRSFMSCMFTKGVNKELECLLEELLISTPLGETYVSHGVFKGYTICIDESELSANLIPLDI